jgi:hypothetical protein
VSLHKHNKCQCNQNQYSNFGRSKSSSNHQSNNHQSNNLRRNNLRRNSTYVLLFRQLAIDLYFHKVPWSQKMVNTNQLVKLSTSYFFILKKGGTPLPASHQASVVRGKNFYPLSNPGVPSVISWTTLAIWFAAATTSPSNSHLRAAVNLLDGNAALGLASACPSTAM